MLMDRLGIRLISLNTCVRGNGLLIMGLRMRYCLRLLNDVGWNLFKLGYGRVLLI